MGILLSILLGSLITWLVTRWYYLRAGDELRAEGRELRRLTTLILESLAAEGIIKVTRDASGTITGFIVHTSGTARMTPGRALGNPTVTPRDVPRSGADE